MYFWWFSEPYLSYFANWISFRLYFLDENEDEATFDISHSWPALSGYFSNFVICIFGGSLSHISLILQIGFLLGCISWMRMSMRGDIDISHSRAVCGRTE